MLGYKGGIESLIKEGDLAFTPVQRPEHYDDQPTTTITGERALQYAVGKVLGRAVDPNEQIEGFISTDLPEWAKDAPENP